MSKNALDQVEHKLGLSFPQDARQSLGIGNKGMKNHIVSLRTERRRDRIRCRQRVLFVGRRVVRHIGMENQNAHIA